MGGRFVGVLRGVRAWMVWSGGEAAGLVEMYVRF